MDEGKLMDTLLAIKEDTGYTRARVDTLCVVTDDHEVRIRQLEDTQPLRLKKIEKELLDCDQELQLDRVDHVGNLVKKIVVVAAGVVVTIIGAAVAIYTAIYLT